MKKTFITLLVIILISCQKNSNKIEVSPEKFSYKNPHFVPVRAARLSDVFLLEGGTGSKVEFEQSLNNKLRQLQRILTNQDNGVYKYILMETSTVDLNSQSKFSTIISKKLIDNINLFAINMERKYCLYNKNYQVSQTQRTFSEDEDGTTGTITAHYNNQTYYLDEEVTNSIALENTCIDWYWTVKDFEGNVISEDYLFTTCPNNGGGGGMGYGDGENAPGGNQNHLCGTYRWKTIGSANYAQINGLAVTFVSADKAMFTVTYGIACVSLPQSSAPETTDANKAFNDAWDYAMSQNMNDINKGGPLGGYIITANTTAYIKAYLQTNYPGATFNKEGCTGSIPATLAKYC